MSTWHRSTPPRDEKFGGSSNPFRDPSSLLIVGTYRHGKKDVLSPLSPPLERTSAAIAWWYVIINTNQLVRKKLSCLLGLPYLLCPHGAARSRSDSTNSASSTNLDVFFTTIGAALGRSLAHYHIFLNCWLTLLILPSHLLPVGGIPLLSPLPSTFSLLFFCSSRILSNRGFLNSITSTPTNINRKPERLLVSIYKYNREWIHRKSQTLPPRSRR